MPEIKPTATEAALFSIGFPRMGLWLWVTVALAIAAFFFVPHMLQVAVYKLGLITAGGYVGYWISRGLEKRGWRPHELVEEAKALRLGDHFKHPGASQESLNARAWELDQLAAAAYQRRTWVVAACMIAAALGS